MNAITSSMDTGLASGASLDTRHLDGGQKLAVKYFSVAMILFIAQLLFGLLAGLQFILPGFLFDLVDFSVNRMIHINAMVVWLLYGFIGAVYWFLEDESRHRDRWPQAGQSRLLGADRRRYHRRAGLPAGPDRSRQRHHASGSSTKAANISKRRAGPTSASSRCMLVFFYNVAATFSKGRWTGISGVLTLDLVALAGLYLAGMFYSTNITVDQYWWWWVIHLWVEATWEVLVGCIMAWSLIKLIGARRKIVQTWLYIEVALMFGSGILGLGHHYFWIGTPGLLAGHRRLLLGAGADPAGRHGRALGL